MKRKRLRLTLSLISRALNIHSYDAEDSALHALIIGHELCHAIVLRGKAVRDCDFATSEQIDTLTPENANRHEMCTVALHLAGLSALSCAGPRTLSDLVRLSYTGLIPSRLSKHFTPLLYPARGSYCRAIRAHQPALRHVQQFVQTVDTFSRYLP